MGKININRTAQIAFINLNDDEKCRYEKSIQKDIDNANKFMNLIANVEPTTKITKNICYREDNIIPSSNRDDLLRNAKGNSNGAFTVPKIVE